VYFSFNSGKTWTQPTYTGCSARATTTTNVCSSGPIGTVPKYFESGLVSDGDPAVAFGPVPDSVGNFSWGNGSRLYYANLTSNFSTKRSEAGFKGSEAVAVSRTDDPATAATGGTAGQDAWMAPVVITGTSGAAAKDKDQVWADNAATSPNFGNVYVCFALFKSGVTNSATLDVSRSTDGGATWSKPVGVADINANASGCTVRTDSAGNVYVGYVSFAKKGTTETVVVTKSTNGGATFQQLKTFTTVLPGEFDAVLGRFVEDGVAGARDDLAVAPSLDVANGAPTGSGATNELVLSWVDGVSINHEHAMFTFSTDGGTTWQTPAAVEQTGLTPPDRPYYSAVAISPSGGDVYVVYNAFTNTFAADTDSSRTLLAVVRHAAITSGTPGAFTTLHRSKSGDPRGSSQNNLAAEFLGDYIYAAATDAFAVAVWNDTRNASVCHKEQDYRQALRTSPTTAVRPAPDSDCTSSFGNSDIFGGTFTP
jgi:hypothetical protein